LLGDAVGDGVVWATPSRVDRNLERGHYGLAAGSAGSGRFSVAADTLWHAGTLAAEVEALAADLGAVGVWAVLHGASVAIAARLARHGNLPMHVTVHDDPVYATALRSRRTALLVPLIARQFKRVLQVARSVDVVCEPMGDRYRRKYSVACTVLHRGLAEPVAPGPTHDLGRCGLQVGILGNTYSARQQLVVLARAVERAAAQLGTQPRFVVCGGGPTGAMLKHHCASRADVEIVGHVSEAEGIRRLQTCTVLYLNYPFTCLTRVLRETSFPTKLSTYVCAARPIFLHAPPRTSLTDLPAAGHYITRWHTLDDADGANKLVELCSDPQTAQSFHESAEMVRRRYYDLATHRATLDRLLGSLNCGHP
jgi:hypothetical protein